MHSRNEFSVAGWHEATFVLRQRRDLCVALSLFIVAIVNSQSFGKESVEFNRDIRPVLSDKCFACHGPDPSSREADLRLDTEQSAKSDRGGHAAIVPGLVDQSDLIRRITTLDSAERMPPEHAGPPLTESEVQLLSRWIEEGAPWQMAWTYVPPRTHELPTIKNVAWPINWIDRFILARIESEGLEPSAEADATTLVRRLYIDLIGIPPTSTEVDEFINDQSATAYESLVDRLLSSQHFGERMAMYWLDLVRYADTVGYHGDQEHAISPYRDYVIKAFNRNVPFDQFTREQLAGDLLPDPSLEQRIATGYNRVLQTSHEGGVQPKEYLAIYAADHVRNLSAVWLGGTLGCAQCHDHKYDPYTTKDFYAMAAFFADIDEAQHLTVGFDVSPTIRAPELDLPNANEKVELAALSREVDSLTTSLAEGDAQNAQQTSEHLAELNAKISSIRQTVRKSMVTVAIAPRETRILPRGDWMSDQGEVVQPAIPEFLGALSVSERRPHRLDLANWLTDSKNGAGGLTSRVFVNRLWYLCFGRGLSASLDDLGGQGYPPDHPELLDALAIEFIDSGWDVKHVLKLLVMSQTYRQSSMASAALDERDPTNRLVARQTRYRYSAECVRDTALRVSGLLVPVIGGSSVRPYQPAGYYKHLNFPVREYQADVNVAQWRRGVYMHWQRQYLHPMLKAFDAPSREECMAQRPRSNTALAALNLLNDPTFCEAARAFACRILKFGGDTIDERISYAFRQAVSREADSEERGQLALLLSQSEAYYQNNQDAADQLLAIGIFKAPSELDSTQLAAWTIVARAIINHSESTTRN